MQLAVSAECRVTPDAVHGDGGLNSSDLRDGQNIALGQCSLLQGQDGGRVAGKFARSQGAAALHGFCLREQATDISQRLKHRQLGAHTVQVKVRYSDFTTLTRQISVKKPITEAADIYRLGCFLLGRDKLVSRPLRLLGLGVSSLREPGGRQLPLL
jgi:nucleotidyltransferase/DNA polymerase involved in DNA repair